eukprot:PhF_6_TR37206/c0_g1_i2/m.54836
MSCGHNSWDGVYDKSHSLQVRCRLCGSCGSIPRNGNVCSAFSATGRCPLAAVCRDLHVYIGKAHHHDPNHSVTPPTTIGSSDDSNHLSTMATSKRRRCGCGWKTRNPAAMYCAGCGRRLSVVHTDGDILSMLVALGITAQDEQNQSSLPTHSPQHFHPKPPVPLLPPEDQEDLVNLVEKNRQRLGNLRESVTATRHVSNSNNNYHHPTPPQQSNNNSQSHSHRSTSNHERAAAFAPKPKPKQRFPFF